MPVFFRRQFGLVVWAIGLALVGFASINGWFLVTTRSRIVEPESITRPPRIGVLLGCEPVLSTGRTNEHFQRRVLAAAGLLHCNQISRLIISGHPDNHGYNEPREMRQALVASGISPDQLTLHEDGRRTFDTLRWAARQHVGPIVLVSDRSHLPRALALAHSVGIDAVGVAAQGSPLSWHEAAVRLRETLARCRAVWDLLTNE